MLLRAVPSPPPFCFPHSVSVLEPAEAPTTAQGAATAPLQREETKGKNSDGLIGQHLVPVPRKQNNKKPPCGRCGPCDAPVAACFRIWPSWPPLAATRTARWLLSPGLSSLSPGTGLMGSRRSARTAGPQRGRRAVIAACGSALVFGPLGGILAASWRRRPRTSSPLR
ncbi:uncharacterized protein TrAFT101_009926 [Trichoderma asperellum]|uniref:uncharacterized protein n=1 Tax=Trichoderma asperellum TaxID=101201 RepID=UPI0033262B09|nr:hypothetical protein TrAFT101_009926 [Trichoderma asperellum]